MANNAPSGLSGLSMRLQWNWNAQAQMELIFEELMKVARDMGKAHKTQREKTIATWDGDRPSWRYFVFKYFPKKVRFVIKEGGEPFGRKKWLWLDEGTKVRYMHVSANWESKTRVGWIGSGQGKGWTTGLGFPLPGIKAREWTGKINTKLEKRTIKRFKTALKKGLKRRRRGKFASITAIRG